MGDCKTSIRGFESHRRLQHFRYESAHSGRFLLSPVVLYAISLLFSGGIQHPKLKRQPLPRERLCQTNILAFLADTYVLGVCLSTTYILVGIPVTEIIDKRGIYVPIHALISV